MIFLNIAKKVARKNQKVLIWRRMFMYPVSNWSLHDSAKEVRDCL